MVAMEMTRKQPLKAGFAFRSLQTPPSSCVEFYDPNSSLLFCCSSEAVGCAQLAPLPNAWSIRDGDGTTVRCNFSADAFKLRCAGNTWIGDVVNCSGGM